MPGESLIGNLAILLSMDTAAFEKGSTHAQKLMARTQKQFEAVGKKITGVGAAMTVGLTAPFAAFAAKGIKEAQETAEAMGQVNAALASMGPVAGRTADQLQGAADAFEMHSLFEADEILRKVTANMLTFGNISGAAFDQAQQAAIDLATRMNTDLQSATLLVGKALNDPIKGLTALGRAGIQFTAAQKESIKAMVEAGNAAGAQAIILGELKREFGGAAEAAQKTDPFNKLHDAFNQLAEKVGTALLPLLPVLTDALVSVLNWFTSLSPATQKWLLIIAGVGAALGPTLIGIGSMVRLFGAVLPLLIKLGPLFSGLIPLVISLGRALMLLALNPVGATILAIAAAVGAVYLAWKNWDKIVAIAAAVYNAVKTWIGDKLTKVLNLVLLPIRAVQAAFKTLYDKVVGHSYVPDMVQGIADEMAKLDRAMVQPARAAAGKTADAFRALQTDVASLMSRLFPEAAAFNVFNQEIATLDAALKAHLITVQTYREAWGAMIAEAVNGAAFTGEAMFANDTLDAGTGGDTVADLANRAFEALPDLAARANDALLNVARSGIASLADGLTGVLTGTAKLGEVFAQVARQIIADLIRIQIQKLLVSAAGSLGLGNLFGGARAAGGPVVSGKAYLVGERGPEIFAPGRSGRIIANDNLSGAANQNMPPVHIHFDGDVDQRKALVSGRQAATAFRNHLAYLNRTGG